MDPTERQVAAFPPPCGYTLLWWDGEGEGSYVCVLAAGHLTLHTDGSVTFDDDDTIDCFCPWYCRLHPATLPIGGPCRDDRLDAAAGLPLEGADHD